MLLTAVPFFVVGATWRLPDTYHSAGSGRGTATLKFYEDRDILQAACTRTLRVDPMGTAAAGDQATTIPGHRGRTRGERTSRNSAEADDSLRHIVGLLTSQNVMR